MCAEFNASVNAGIEYLAQYREAWGLRMQGERERVVATIKYAIQEAENCLGRGNAPSYPLARALLAPQAEELRMIRYILAPPNLPSICQSWITYQSTLSSVNAPFIPSQLALNLMHQSQVLLSSPILPIVTTAPIAAKASRKLHFFVPITAIVHIASTFTLLR